MLIDILFFVYCILIIASCVHRTPLPVDDDYMSVEHTTNMRGIAAVGIIMHHLSERISEDNGMFFSKLPVAGYLLVTFFFFLSGYGLLIQYNKKKVTYLNGFLVKRVLYLIIVYLLDILLYLLAGIITGKTYTLWNIFKSIFISGIASNSWYMIVLIEFYLAFYCIFKCRKIEKLSDKIIAVFVFQVLYFVVLKLLDFSPMWYLSNFGFSLGMIWAYNKDELDELLEKKYKYALLIATVLFCFFYGTPVITDRVCSEKVAEIIRIIFRLISSPMSVVLLVVLSFKCRPSMKLWNRLGGISLEIYLIHGLVMTLLKNSLHVQNGFIWTVLTIIISVLIAAPVHKMNELIAKKCRSIAHN